MKKLYKTIAVIGVMFILFISKTAYAHSGRTDSRGGHKDNKNVSGLGYYHYHCGGNPPHLHENGVCPYSSKAAVKTAPVENVDKITLSNVPTKMNIGDNSSVTYKITSSSSNPVVKWESSDENVISIGSRGELYANNSGQATVTVSAEGQSKTFTVEVSAVPVENVTLSADKLVIQSGRTEKVNVQISPENASYKNVTWVSENEDIAVVDNYGNIKAKSAGETKVYVKSHNDISSYVNINVYEVFPEQIEINSKEIELDINETYKMTVKVLPENTNNSNLTYECDNDIVTIEDDGTIVPSKTGKSVITVTTVNGISEIVYVNVYSKSRRQAMAGGSVLGLGACIGGAYTYKRKKKLFIK